jgi:hypothetical protein
VKALVDGPHDVEELDSLLVSLLLRYTTKAQVLHQYNERSEAADLRLAGLDVTKGIRLFLKKDMRGD